MSDDLSDEAEALQKRIQLMEPWVSEDNDHLQELKEKFERVKAVSDKIHPIQTE